MKGKDAFISLYKKAFEKCFGFGLAEPLTETESKHFGNSIFEDTGLVIGAKSLKNYSAYVLNNNTSRSENPSTATLDTLARYVLEIPYTSELKRKANESHYPYWFQYQISITDEKTTAKAGIVIDQQTASSSKKKKWVVWAIIAATLIAIVVYFLLPKKYSHFNEDFHTVQEDSLKNNGWFLMSEDTAWWKQRNQTPSHITLFTLMGDSWGDAEHVPVIKNLLLRKLTSNCFITEIRLDDFIPLHRWQQAGIIFLEDTLVTSKSLRVSFAYNDFFGGYNKPKEIIIQAVYSGESNRNNPEEIIHFPLFSLGVDADTLIKKNLQNSALRVERNTGNFRFLYATGQVENFAYKEIRNKEVAFNPKYVGIFALEGFVNYTSYIPAHFKYFKLIDTRCGE